MFLKPNADARAEELIEPVITEIKRTKPVTSASLLADAVLFATSRGITSATALLPSIAFVAGFATSLATPSVLESVDWSTEPT